MFLLFIKDYPEAGDIGTTNTNSTEESLQNDNPAIIGKIVDELKYWIFITQRVKFGEFYHRFNGELF